MLTAKQEYDANKTDLTVRYKVTDCRCDYAWRHIRPGHHNNQIGYLVGHTSNNELIISVSPDTPWCQTTSWEQVIHVTTVQIPNNTNAVPTTIDRFNYDGPGSKLSS